MNNLRTAISIIEAESRDIVDAANTVEGKLTAAFSIARDHWMFTDEDTQFQAAIGVVMSKLDKDSIDYRRMEEDLTVMRILNAMISGVPVDLSQIGERETETLGLVKMWKDK